MGRQQERICIIDDDRSIRRALNRLLLAMGYEVRTFASAMEFLDTPPAERGSCLILDVHMPGMDGLQLQQELSSQGSCMPVIFISADRDPLVGERAVRAGAVGFLQKPFDSSLLLDMIDSALTGTRK